MISTVTWLVALSGLSTIFTWLAICLCQYVRCSGLNLAVTNSISISIRFRAAWKAQGHSLEELPFQALAGVWGSWFGVVLLSLVLVAQFYIVCVQTFRPSLF